MCSSDLGDQVLGCVLGTRFAVPVILAVVAVLNLAVEVAVVIGGGDRLLELAVIDREVAHALVFPCRRVLGGRLSADCGHRVDVDPTHWRDEQHGGMTRSRPTRPSPLSGSISFMAIILV